MKVVLNKCFGGFGLSEEAQQLYAKKSGFELFFYKQTEYEHQNGKRLFERADGNEVFSNAYKMDLGDSFSNAPDDSYWYYGDIERTDKLLIEVVEELGSEKASNSFSELEVVEIPDGIEWGIDDYDGIESIHEAHRSW